MRQTALLRTAWLAPLVFALTLCPSRRGLAQPSAQPSASDKALAEALFDEGRKLMDQKDYGQACPKFERSQELANGIGTLLYLADCYEKNGQFASSWAMFREAASRANARGEVERERIAVRRAAVLEPMLAKLTIVVEGDAAVPGLSITRNTRRVEHELWGLPSPVDPGLQALDAVAPGKQPWHGSINLADGEVKVVKIPVLSDAPTPSAPAVAAAAPPALGSRAPWPPPAAPATVPPASGQKTAAYVVGALGLVGLGVGTAFGLAANGSNHTANDHCTRPGGLCDEQGVAAGEDVDRRATVSNVAFGLGAAALVGGVVLYFTAPSQPPSAASLFRLTAGAAAHGGQVALSGVLP
jgi:hypothetical protein